MKKVFLAILVVAFTAILSVPALAEDVFLDAKVTRVDQLMDRNGNPYVRIIIEEARILKGVSYTTEVPVMAFGERVAQAKDVKDQIKAIADKRNFQGRTSYTILKLVK